MSCNSYGNDESYLSSTIKKLTTQELEEEGREISKQVHTGILE